MRSCELVSFVTAVACNMANCYSDEELAVMAAVFTQLGDTLATILANEALLEAICSDEKENPENTDNNTNSDDTKNNEKDCDFNNQDNGSSKNTK